MRITNVVSLIEYDYTVLGKLSRYSFRDLWIKQVMIRVDDDITERHLQLELPNCTPYHSPGSEIRTLLVFLPILHHPIKGIHPRRNQIMRFQKLQVLG